MATLYVGLGMRHGPPASFTLFLPLLPSLSLLRPRLGDSLGKVVAAGAIYFVFALVDGVVRVKQVGSGTQLRCLCGLASNICLTSFIK